jgi:hypothetical protein
MLETEQMQYYRKKIMKSSTKPSSSSDLPQTLYIEHSSDCIQTLKFEYQLTGGQEF